MNTMTVVWDHVCISEDTSFFCNWRRSVLLLMAALLVPIATANAQVCWPETQKMTPGIGGGYVFAGMSVSVSGGVMVVGIADDDGKSGTGGDAYIYLLDNQANQWVETQHLQNLNGAVGDHFGFSASVFGDVIAIGEPGDTPLDTGRVFVYERDSQSGLWVEVEQLTAWSPFPENHFGTSVSVSGDVLAVGAFDYVNGTNQGSVSVFERDNSGTWLQTQELQDQGGIGPGSGYGLSVSVSGGVIVVGQPYDNPQGNDSGSVLVYERDGQGVWQQTQKLLQPGGNAANTFGYSVSICGTAIAIGVPGDDDQGIDSGSTFVFERDILGVWQPTALPLPSSGATGDVSGISVSISGNTIVTGSQWDDDLGNDSGSAHVYQRDSVTGLWLEEEQVLASDGAQDYWFGGAVSISGETIAVAGGYYFVNGGGPGWPVGRAYVYTLDPTCQTTSLEICDNGIDDDCDGWIDCDDPDCTGDSTFNGFIDSGQALGSSLSNSVSLGDVDGDGDLDALVVNNLAQPNEVWINQGGNQSGTPGQFLDSGQALGNFMSTAGALGDLDGDGDLDAFVANRNQPNKVWINQGGAQSGTPGQFLDSGQVLGSSESNGISLGDVDDDGDLDAFVVNHSVEPNRVWINQGGAQSGTPGQFLDSGQALGSFFSNNVSLGDVDNDGDLDAFVVHNVSQPNEVWINQGGAQSGTPGQFLDSGQALGNLNSLNLDLGDIDDDGDLDALVANVQGPIKVWINQGGAQSGTPGQFLDSGQALGNLNSLDLDLGDVDDDGDLDVFLPSFLGQNSGGQPNEVWLNDGTGNFTDSGQALGSSISITASLGDVDDDGDLDAFVANRNQPNKVWINDFNDLCSGMIGDFNGDRCVDGIDLAMLLGQWGVRNPPTGDIDRDNDVDGQDLALLLGNWLACPG